MLILTYACSVCKIWRSKIRGSFTSIVSESDGLVCGNCGAMDSFVITRIRFVWRIDVIIPEKWVASIWEKAKLCWVKVGIPYGRCEICGHKIKIVPDFLIKGTRLTLEALILVTLAKEVSGMSWRKLCAVLCRDGDGCAFTTLYEAVHRVGKFLASEKMEVFESARRACSTAPEPYLLRTEAVVEGFGRLSARHKHTISREMGARSLVGGLVADGMLYRNNFIGWFYGHLFRWSKILSAWAKTVPPLYQRKILQTVKITT